MLRRYVLYLFRWQLSTPILAVCVAVLAALGEWWATAVANLIGGLIFFWVDRFIFTARLDAPIWSVRGRAVCVECGRTARGYALVAARNYDRRDEAEHAYRCEVCSQAKLARLRTEGVVA